MILKIKEDGIQDIKEIDIMKVVNVFIGKKVIVIFKEVTIVLNFGRIQNLKINVIISEKGEVLLEEDDSKVTITFRSLDIIDNLEKNVFEDVELINSDD